MQIGALEPTRLAQFKERRARFEDPDNDIPPFLYGSHYSNVGTVAYYLLRLEPFTTIALALQVGASALGRCAVLLCADASACLVGRMGTSTTLIACSIALKRRGATAS